MKNTKTQKLQKMTYGNYINNKIKWYSCFHNPCYVKLAMVCFCSVWEECVRSAQAARLKQQYLRPRCGCVLIATHAQSYNT